MAAGGGSQDRNRRRGQTSARGSERARRTGGGSAAKRPGGKQPTRARQRSGAAGAFKLSSTRRAAGLAMLVCVMALSVSVPLRTFLSQQAELDAQEQQQAALSREVADLQQRKEKLADPAHVEAQARERLGYVRPGETPYTVQLPEDLGGEEVEPPEPGFGDAPWYERLWQSVMGGQQ